MTLAEKRLIEEAKERFPIGCIIEDVDGDTLEITEDCVYLYRGNILDVYRNYESSYRVFACYHGKWSKVIQEAPCKLDPFF